MADTLVRFMVDKLNSLIQKKIELIWGVDKEMNKLYSLFSTIQDVLEDAEEKQIKEKALQNWLRKLKDATYKVYDILDECALEATRLESYSCMIKKVHTSFLSYLCPHDILFRSKIGSKMRGIRKRLDEIVEERLKFILTERVVEKRSNVIENRQTGSILAQFQVYGRDQDKEIIVKFLMENVIGFDGVSVYAIIGLVGLGKTTLAQMVFNDERIKNHFELRIWVCVSEDFNSKRIMKVIIEFVTGFTCPNFSLDLLQRRLQEKLNGQRCLLVLDDVWNEDEEKWDRLKSVLACGSRGSSIIVTTRIKIVASIIGTMPLLQFI